MTLIITQPLVDKILSVIDAGLTSGVGTPTPGEMCVEAAICYSLGLPHGDDPKCVAQSIRSLKIILNDSCWSNNAARAAGLRRLAILQLGTSTNFNEAEFVEKLAMFTVTNQLPAWYGVEANDCKTAKSLNEAYKTAYDLADLFYKRHLAAKAGAEAVAAAEAAKAGARAVAEAAAKAGAEAAEAAAEAAEAVAAAAAGAAEAVAAAAAGAADEILNSFIKGVEQILIEMKVPGAEFLP